MDHEDYIDDDYDDFDYRRNDDNSTIYSFDNMDEFLNDSEEFTSFISSGYGTRSNSTNPSTLNGDATDVINSLRLDIPELEPILSNSPKKEQTKQMQRTGSRAKMTDLGFKMSKMIMSSSRKAEADEDEICEDMLESGDTLVDNYGQGKKRQRTGKRGRPKGTVKIGTQFGRASSTHSLPPNVSALMGQANVCYVQKQYSKAIDLYLQVVQRAPSSPEPYYSLGLVHEEQGDVDKAASYFLISAHLQPRADGELWRRISALLVQVPRKEQAIYCLTRAIKAPKLSIGHRIEDDFPLFWLRAKLQLELGQYKSVLTGFGTALRGHFSQDPEDLSLFVLVARLAVRMSLAYVAVEVFKNVFRSAVVAALPITWSHLNVLIELSEVDEDYGAIIESMEEFSIPCYLQTGKEQGKTDWILKSPKEQLEKALRSSEMPVELKLKMKIARIHSGIKIEQDEGDDDILKLFNQLDRPGMKLKLSLADALSLSNSPMSAVKILLECIDSDENLATSDFCLKIGQNYRKAGELEMAVESFLAVLQVDPDHRATRLALSEVYRSLGKIEQALQILPTTTASEAFETQRKEVEEDKDESFINWTGLDELFVKVIGIGIDFESVNMDDSSESESVEDENYTLSKKQLRFGPERQKRGKRKHNYSQNSFSYQSLRSNYEKLIISSDKNSGGVLLQCFSDNLEFFKNGNFGGLEEWEWSEALLKVLIMKSKELLKLKVDKSEWDRLMKILKNILSTNLRVDGIKWKILGIILSIKQKHERADELMNNLKGLLSTNLIGTSILPSIFMNQSEGFLAAFYHPITFRFLSRLNRRFLYSNPALLVILGHQSLETQNYDEASRMYLKAIDLVPQWTFVKLCIGNSLLGRAFQRTCPNQLSKLMQGIGFFLEYSRESHSSGLIQSWYNLARAFHQIGFLSQSVKYYKMCIESGDEAFSPLSRYNLSRLYLQNGSNAMARLTLK